MKTVAHEVVLAHADNPSAYLALNEDTQHYAPSDSSGFVPYVLAGRRRTLALFGPIAATADEQLRVWEDFESWSARQRRSVVVLQASRDFGQKLAERGYTVNQLGAGFSVSLPELSLKGKKFKTIRNNIGNARRAGVEVREVPHGDYQMFQDTFDAVDRRWLRAKGPLTRPLHFMVGDRYHTNQIARRIFVVELQARIIGYSTFVPSPVRAGDGYLWDLTRRVRDAPRGTNELLVHTAAAKFLDEGHEWLHMGLTPFIELRPEWELPSASGWLRTVCGLVARHGGWLYPAQNNQQFKQKWGPQRIIPEYMAFQNAASLHAIVSTLRRLGVLP